MARRRDSCQCKDDQLPCGLCLIDGLRIDLADSQKEVERLRGILEKPEIEPRWGHWFGAARLWLKSHKYNGERVTWGSSDVLKPPFTARDVDDLALAVARSFSNQTLSPQDESAPAVDDRTALDAIGNNPTFNMGHCTRCGTGHPVDGPCRADTIDTSLEDTSDD